MKMDPDVVASVVDRMWIDLTPTLQHYITIPAKSPAFDPDWQANGHIAAAVDLIRSWCAEQAPDGSVVLLHEIDGRTPVIAIDVPAVGLDPGDIGEETVLLYGHLDKQPEMDGWRSDLSPWVPHLEGDRLYGRGGADDGYAAFAIITALVAIREAGGSHRRCVALIEASEESGSVDLPAHLNLLRTMIGDVSLVVCLDSGAPDYDRLWQTTSLRGMLQAEVRVDVLGRAMHSGLVSGAVPSSFRLLRQLLDRVEEAETGRVQLPAFHVEIPTDRRVEAARAASVGVDPRKEIDYAGMTAVQRTDPAELLLATTWEPTLSYIGADGLPSLVAGGNVIRPYTTIGLSFRLPPTCDPSHAAAQLVEVLEANPPSGASVTVSVTALARGWNANPTEPWLADALDTASFDYFGDASSAWGVGGSIPFMAMLGESYPRAQFVITGVLGPESNAHGPNEFLHLPTARRVSAAVASILTAHSQVQRAR